MVAMQQIRKLVIAFRAIYHQLIVAWGGLLLSLPLLMWIVVSCVTFLLLSLLLACCLGSHPSQTSNSFSNQQHFGKELMPHRALVLLIAFRALPSVNCCLGLLFSSPLLLWIVICCDDLSIAIVIVILPLFAASKNRN